MSTLTFTDEQNKLYPNLETFGAAVYGQMFGVRFSDPIINKMGPKSMATLMIHESLRHISITDGVYLI
jgi:hypothetical protein